jgi:secernin
LISDDAYPFARRKGWCSSTADFDFAVAFGDPKYSTLSGGVDRSACTLRGLNRRAGKLQREDFFAALRDHNGIAPDDGWRMKMPCAHSSWWPTRAAGQTTASMVSRLQPGRQSHWLTGTSSPCLSIFKPFEMGDEMLFTGRTPGAGYDNQTLFWEHERLHRLVLRNYETLKQLFNDARMAMEADFVASGKHLTFGEMWARHLETLPEWLRLVEKEMEKGVTFSLFHRYWSQQEKLDGIPAHY